MTAALRDRLARVRLVVTDVDGVLTDGTLWYAGDGEAIKAFHVRDGAGIRALIDSGVEVAVVTARRSEAVARRLADLGVARYLPGRADKRDALAELAAAAGVDAGEVAYVGDDALDLPALAAAGVAIAVADAHASVRAAADWVTRTPGGRGALREVADAICAARAAADPRFTVAIPARYGSERLPGKPLRAIAGRPMIEHVVRRAVDAGAAEVWVATDDERIAAAARAAGARAALTSPACASGTDRIAALAEHVGWSDDRIVVNLQGDEPAMPPALVRLVAGELAARPDVGIATVAVPVRAPAELFDPNAVKVVCADDGRALWFSRAPIPWVRGAFALGAAPDELPAGVPFLRHVGLYAYRVGDLRRLAALPPHPLETAERLEQLRALAAGVGVYVARADAAPPAGVDVPEDIARVEEVLRGR